MGDYRTSRDHLFPSTRALFQLSSCNLAALINLRFLSYIQSAKKDVKALNPNVPPTLAKLWLFQGDKNVCLVTVTVIADVNASEDVDAFI